MFLKFARLHPHTTRAWHQKTDEAHRSLGGGGRREKGSTRVRRRAALAIWHRLLHRVAITHGVHSTQKGHLASFPSNATAHRQVHARAALARAPRKAPSC
eukprot:6211463-Pleurochrysis_carterae.AAC.4